MRDSLVLCLLLPILWYGLFRPFTREDLLIFIVAGMFITIQNYTVLRTGAFAFARRDFLLMPYYAPLLWGFYFLSLRRFFAEGEGKGLGWKAVAGLGAMSLAFGLFAGTPLLQAAVFSATAFLFVMFHSRRDLEHGLYTLLMGFAVEVFGVASGEWSYPRPDMLGIPFWFAPMWIAVGILGRRLLFPLVEVMDRALPPRRPG